MGYLYYLERGGADGACKACWPGTHGSNCTNNTLDGLLTADTHEPRAAWWAYKAYADSVSTRVESSASDPRLAVFAGATSQSASVLVGYFAYNDYSPPTLPLVLNLDNLSRLPFLVSAKSVHVTVESIPASGEAALAAPLKVTEQDIPVVRGSVVVPMPALNLHEAYIITVSKAVH